MFQVFIENEAGSTTKHHHDEKALTLSYTEEVSRKYPYPYGFVLNTTSGDGDNVDCFVLTDRALKTGEILEVVPVGFMEQFTIEAGVPEHVDHNVLAVPADSEFEDLDSIEYKLREFVEHVFDHVEGKVLRTGEFTGPQDAIDFIESCRD